MRERLLLLLVAGCTQNPPVDPCAAKPVIAGGSAELGLGTSFAPIVDGQTVDLERGLQGLWMFMINARARDMDVGSGDREAAIDVAALDQSGTTISLETGCRVREFTPASNGALQLYSPYALPLDPSIAQLDGAKITIRIELRDHDGRRAIDERTIVAHQPF